MKRISYKTARHTTLRWLMSAAMLFYVLVPQVGACRCVDCNCCKHSDSQDTAVVAEITKPLKHSCCSKQVAAPPKDCCAKATGEDAPHEPSCPCLLKPVPKTPQFVSSPSILLPQMQHEGILGGYLPYVASILPAAVSETISLYNPFESPASRLAVRLHLLLLVLRN